MDEMHSSAPGALPVNRPAYASSTPSTIALESSEDPGMDPTFVFIHGFAENRHVWMNVASSIAAAHRRVFVDLRGHGGSRHAACDSYGVDADVCDVLRFLDQAARGPIVLVGHSLGGAIAMRLASISSLAVHRLIIVDTSLSASTDASRHVRATLEAALSRRWTLAEYRRWLIDQRPLTPSDELSRIAESMLDLSDDGTGVLRVDRRVLDHRPARIDLSDVLWRIRCPTLLIRGALSGVLSEPVARDMARQMPHATLATVPMAGHAVFSDNPKGFCAVTDRWLARHPLESRAELTQSKRNA